MYFCSQNDWLIFKDHKLGCKICSNAPLLAVQKEQGVRLPNEWRECFISAFGTDKAKQQQSLRKKIKEHADSKSNLKAASRDEIKQAFASHAQG